MYFNKHHLYNYCVCIHFWGPLHFSCILFLISIWPLDIIFNWWHFLHHPVAFPWRPIDVTQSGKWGGERTSAKGNSAWQSGQSGLRTAAARLRGSSPHTRSGHVRCNRTGWNLLPLIRVKSTVLIALPLMSSAGLALSYGTVGFHSTEVLESHAPLQLLHPFQRSHWIDKKRFFKLPLTLRVFQNSHH